MVIIPYCENSVIRRLMAVLSEQASLEAQKEAALRQAQSASAEASRQMEKTKVTHYCNTGNVIRD